MKALYDSITERYSDREIFDQVKETYQWFCATDSERVMEAVHNQYLTIGDDDAFSSKRIELHSKYSFGSNFLIEFSDTVRVVYNPCPKHVDERVVTGKPALEMVKDIFDLDSEEVTRHAL